MTPIAPTAAPSRHLAGYRANEERLATLAAICRELNAAFSGKASVTEDAGVQPPAWSIRVAAGGLFATFGVIDATYFWTFDGGESCHYAKDEGVMRRLLTLELRSALSRGNIQ
ncbi:MAG: hypothetical protein WDM84_06375 [Bauldia sp.]